MGDETIALPLHIARQILQILTTSFYFSQTQDLGDSYRELKTDAKWSRMTQELSRQIEVLASYIEEVEQEEVSEDVEQDGERESG